MSVFTNVSWQSLCDFLDQYKVGDLTHFEGIAAGVENSNFYVDTTRGKFVLTVFERVNAHDVPYFLTLTDYLSKSGLPCAQPQVTRKGDLYSQLLGKPASLVQYLPGTSLERSTEVHCHHIGVLLAKIHRVSRNFPYYRRNPYDDRWLSDTRSALESRIDIHIRGRIDDELERCKLVENVRLPRGTVHTDLFRDNVLLTNDEISGVIDFYYACTDSLILDLATVANDWCVVDGNYDSNRERVLLSGYQSIRPLTPAEIAMWPVYLSRCALRFWLSRLYDHLFPRAGGMVLVKDPHYFQSILAQHATKLTR